MAVPVVVLYGRGQIGRLVFQIMDGGEAAFILIVTDQIEGLIVVAHARFHLGDVRSRDPEIRGNGLHLFVVQPAQTLLGLAQVEEQLALGLGGGHLDHAPVAQHIFVDLGLDPVHGEGNQTHPDTRVEALDRLHQADVAFLHQIGLRQAIAGVALGHVNDKTQMRHDQLTGSLEIATLLQTHRQFTLFLRAQHGDRVDGLDIAFQTTLRNQSHSALQ